MRTNCLLGRERHIPNENCNITDQSDVLVVPSCLFKSNMKNEVFEVCEMGTGKMT
jgi:hypothetical protein